MTKVLIIAEHAGGKLNASTAKCVKAATSLAGSEIAVAVFAGAGIECRGSGSATERRLARHRCEPRRA